MSVVMPPLLQSAQLKPDVIITSADSDNELDDSDDDRYGLLLLGNTTKVRWTIRAYGTLFVSICKN